MRRAVVRRWILGLMLARLAPPVGFVAWNLATDNFAAVEPGVLYRSGQMEPDALAQVVRGHKLRTVLNLRGSHPEEVWYRGEQRATLDAGAAQVDMALSSCEWMSRDQLRTLVHVLDTSERPLLIHCWRGSERTGLAVALARLLEPGSTLADARSQLSLRYLYARVGGGKIMAEHLDQYEAWLGKQRLAHAPEHLRRWAEEGFQPGTPGREDWPYDPVPIVVITRPEPKTSQVAETTSAIRK